MLSPVYDPTLKLSTESLQVLQTYGDRQGIRNIVPLSLQGHALLCLGWKLNGAVVMVFDHSYLRVGLMVAENNLGSSLSQYAITECLRSWLPGAGIYYTSDLALQSLAGYIHHYSTEMSMVTMGVEDLSPAIHIVRAASPLVLPSCVFTELDSETLETWTLEVMKITSGQSSTPCLTVRLSVDADQRPAKIQRVLPIYGEEVVSQVTEFVWRLFHGRFRDRRMPHPTSGQAVTALLENFRTSEYITELREDIRSIYAPVRYNDQTTAETQRICSEPTYMSLMEEVLKISWVVEYDSHKVSLNWMVTFQDQLSQYREIWTAQDHCSPGGPQYFNRSHSSLSTLMSSLLTETALLHWTARYPLGAASKAAASVIKPLVEALAPAEPKES